MKTVRLLTVLSLAALVSQASPILGVTTTTTMGEGFGSALVHIVDGTGLTSYAPGASHSSATATNAWVGTAATGSVTFNLNGLYTLTDIVVWNLNADNRAGVNGVSILGSTDGTTFSSIAGAPSSFAQGANFAAETGQQFPLSGVVSYVRFDITSNYGFGGSTGLSEVMFLGDPVAEPSTVPEPSTWPAIGAGLTTLILLRRRR